MLAQLKATLALPKSLDATHSLVLLPKGKSLPRDVPQRNLLSAVLKRRGIKNSEFADTPIVGNSNNGGLIVWAMIDFQQSTHALQTQVRKALQLLLNEHPESISILVQGSESQRRLAAETAAYIAWLNGVPLPIQKKKDVRKQLQQICVYGIEDVEHFIGLHAIAEGNLLCRTLTVLPPNELTPWHYRACIAELAQHQGWGHREYDLHTLRHLGAGAFVAVAQGSQDEDAAIVHLTYRHPNASCTVALVGKGICFDTGGHNLKSAKYMRGMHEDMNGSAVCLGILLAASQQQLAINIDCWLPLAQNHLSAKAYKQNEIVTALNGTTIEVMHTDAEGRMILADALTFAARGEPDLILDFATLTGSMISALGTRYSGILGNRSSLLEQAVQIGQACGERVCAFPLDDDYDAALESKVADVKQCTLESEADHILAARFLQRFVEDIAWLHMDLSACRCEGGLGATATDVTGFGVAWGIEMLRQMMIKTA